MTDFSALTVFAGVPVRDLGDAVDWYSRVFDRGPDGTPASGIAEWYLAEGRVPEGGTLQLCEDAGRAGGGLATINVGDIAVITRALAAVNIALETQRFPIDAETVGEVTVGTFEDPDGNALTVVQPHLR